MGLNRVVQCAPLKGPGQPYTGIWWGELYHADITDPRTLEDAKRLLDATVVRFKGQVKFLGAWFRNRVSHIPISFSDDALARFSREANNDRPITRQMLQADSQLLERYRNWWMGKRKAFFLALRDYLRENVRRFNAAFLALPALPSRRLADACADPEMVVRAIPTPGGRYGTYVAVAHIGWQPKRNVRITLPFAGKVVDAVTGKELKPVRVERGRIVLNLSLDACELRALVVLPSPRAKSRQQGVTVSGVRCPSYGGGIMRWEVA